MIKLNKTLLFLESNKDLAPRFKKNLIVAQEENLGEVQLRPNSMLFNKASVKTNNNMNSRPLETPLPPTTPKQTNTLLTKEPLPIKQVATDKTKQSKKDKVTKDIFQLDELKQMLIDIFIYF